MAQKNGNVLAGGDKGDIINDNVSKRRDMSAVHSDDVHKGEQTRDFACW